VEIASTILAIAHLVAHVETHSVIAKMEIARTTSQLSAPPEAHAELPQGVVMEHVCGVLMPVPPHVKLCPGVLPVEIVLWPLLA